MLDAFFKIIDEKVIQPIKDDWNSEESKDSGTNKKSSKSNRFISLANDHNKRSQSAINRGYNVKTGKVIRAKTF